MAEFDPDAYLGTKPTAPFDPDAYLGKTIPAVLSEPKVQVEAKPESGGFQQRQRAYREAIHAGPDEVPPGTSTAPPAPQPELRHTSEQLGEKWKQFGKGAPKGVAAGLAGGIAGDVEEMGRHAINKAFGEFTSNGEVVSPKTALPTTTQGGYLGPKGFNVMAPAADENEALGMSVGSMLVPGAVVKAAKIARPYLPKRVPPETPPPAPVREAPPGFETVETMSGKPPPAVAGSDLPRTPDGSPVATAREGTGARLLPADLPHVETAGTLEDTLAGRRSAGAAGASPLAEFSPETIAHMRKTLEQEGVTPWTLEQRLEEMSPHQSLAEFSPNTEAHAGATASSPGAGKNEIINFFAQRAKEAKDRMRSVFDQAFGPKEDLAQQNRVLNIDQSAEAGPLYERFRSMEIPPSPQLDALVDRLQSVGAFGEARAKALAEGRPWQAEWFTPEQRTSPTAQSWDYVKRALDQKIGGSYDPVTGRATDWTRIYTNLKNDLLSAIASHPDKEIASVWREARQAWAGPEEIKNAQRLGRRLLTKAIDADEFRFETAGFGEHQTQGLRQGLRTELENSLGNPGKTELSVMKQVLGENNQQKLRWAIGDEATDAVVRSIEHEFNMHSAPTRIHGNSQTALRQEANKAWTPQPGLFSAGDLTALKHGVTAAAAKTLGKVGLAKLAAREEARFARLRDEAARIYTMQGPERDAVLRYLLTPPPKAAGGRVTKRADGGRTPRLDYRNEDLRKHEVNASVPLTRNLDMTGRAHTFTNDVPLREKPTDWGASIGLRRNFAEGGLTDWVDRGEEGDAQEAREVAARRVARSVLRPQEDIPIPEEPRNSIPREVIEHLGPDYRHGVANQQAGAAHMQGQAIDNMKSGEVGRTYLGLGQGALAPVLSAAAPIGGAMNAVTKGFGRIGPGVEHAAEVATLLNPDTPLLKAAPMIAGAIPAAKAAAKTAVVETGAKLGTKPLRATEAAEDAEAGLQNIPKPVRELGNEGQQADQVAAAPRAPAPGPEGGPGGSGGLEEAQRAAEAARGSRVPIDGLPQKHIEIETPDGPRIFVPGPIDAVHKLAEDYAREAGLKYQPVTSYREVAVPRAKRIAEQFEKMKHDPTDPAVMASYDAMIDETIAQLKAVQKSGLQIEFIKPGMANPYEASPRLAQIDVRDNNHLWVYPTDSGFGTAGSAGAAEALKNNPLLRDTGIEIDGHKLAANDAFRIVHDYFGHIKDGVGFRAAGEENAWRSHSRMYSPLARKAMTSETRGQNSWLNYGPHGDMNRTAKSADTIYADQKIGLMPDWTYRDGAADYFVAPKTEAGARVINAGVDAPTSKSAQTVADPHRMMYPGIYENPKRIAREAAERVAPEDIDMRRLWGVTRGDLDEMAKGRKGNRDPDIYQGPGVARGALSAQNIQTPQNTQRIQDILHEAGKHPGLKHADAWYILDPVYQHMAKMFGPEEAKVRFERLNTLMGMASPGSEVMTEIQRGTAANMKVEQGKFDEFLKYAGTPREFRKGPADLKRVEAHPYHRTSQAEPMQKYLETGKIQSKEAKVPAYVQASSVPEVGFQTRGPVADSHFSRGVGLADTRKGPTDVASSASRSEYHTLQPWWEKEVAGDMGLESVPAQARLWTALGPRTGVTSMLGQGKLELLTKQIMAAAKRMGVTPEQARDMILSGKAHAGMRFGGAVKKAKQAVIETAAQLHAKSAIKRAMRADGGEVPDPFDEPAQAQAARETAAQRVARSAHPDGGRQEGAITRGLDAVGVGAYNAGASIPRLVNSHMQEYQPGVSVEDMPETMHHLPEVAMNAVGVPGGSGGLGSGIRAYHGSPHNFDKFDIKKIGTGEGAQTYGHGLYFAENEAVAKSYRDALNSAGDTLFVKTPWQDARIELSPASFTYPNPQWKAANTVAEWRGDIDKAIAATRPSDASMEQLLKWKDHGAKFEIHGANPGHMYEVNIGAKPEQLLNWDEPMANQREVYGALFPQMKRHRGELQDVDPGAPFKEMRGADVHTAFANFGENRSRAADILREAGVPGIKYADQGSRPNTFAQGMIDKYGSREAALKVARERAANADTSFGIGQGLVRQDWARTVQQLEKPPTSNYVMFDDKLIDILKKYGIALPGAGVAAAGSTRSGVGNGD